MFCSQCGKELKDGTRFCTNCGKPTGVNVTTAQPAAQSAAVQPETVRPTSQPAVQPVTAQSVPVQPTVQPAPVQPTSQTLTEKPAKKSKAWIFIVIGILVIILGVVLGFVWAGRNTEETSGKGKTAGESGASGSDVAVSEMTPLYSNLEIPTIDLRAQNMTPATKQPGVKWDSTLFYWLEDIDQSSSEDGYLAKCRVTKTILRDAADGQLIEYEVYRDPETDEIYKIVSIKRQDDELELVDYYYRGGVPNFMFRRTDSVYTPTYATPNKTGERYYFADNMMARWRIIREPNVIGEYVLAPSANVSYSQADYFAESEEIQQIYDGVELERLNAAYNTYNAIMAQQSIGILEGCVKDTTGTPMVNVTVDVMRTGDDVLLYRTATDENGFFELLTWLDGAECYLVVRGEGEYQDSIVYEIHLTASRLNLSYQNLVLYKESGNEYPVHVNVFGAMEVVTDEDGGVHRPSLNGATAIVREGAGAYTGEGIMTVQAGDGGIVTANLPSGTYTVQIDVAGYATTYVEVVVAEQETTVESYVLPKVPENTYGVVLVWDDTTVDLDLTLFTPQQSAGGDMAHIGGTILADDYGNRLVADNAAGCEVMYMNAAQQGSYKLYVNDYNNSVNGNYTADVLANITIRIYIYDANGFVTMYECPAGQQGVVWEVVEISGKQFTPSQRIYNRLEGKSWWTESKDALDIEACENLKRLLADFTYETIYDGTRYDEATAVEKINSICQGDKESLLEFWGLEGNLPPHEPPVEKYHFNASNYAWFYAMEKEQMEFAAYSLTGKSISFDDVDANVYGDGTCIGFGCEYDNKDYHSLENIETEFLGNATWRVRADVKYFYLCNDGNGEYHKDVEVAEISFLVARNAGSCYDGFRVAGVEELKLTLGETAMAAYERFLNNEEAMYYGSEKLFLRDLEVEMQKHADENYVPISPDVASFNGEYGFIDAGLDGKQELLIDFLGENSDFDVKIVISYINGTLQCVYKEFGWSRNWIDINYAGVAITDGSSGASSGGGSGTLITGDGRVCPLYTESYEYDQSGMPYIFDYDFGKYALEMWQLDFKDREWDALFKYEIGDDVYFCVDDESADGAVAMFLDYLGLDWHVVSEMEEMIKAEIISIVGDATLAEEIWSCDKKIEWYECSSNN